jgi:hypothetical protein
MNARTAIGACMTVLAATCCIQPSGAADNQNDFTDLTGILQRIRQDVGNYEYQAASWRGDITPKISDPAMPPPPFKVACPKSIANYDYDITKVEVTFQAATANTLAGDLGLKIPIGGATVGPDINGSLANTQTRTVILDRIVPYSPAELKIYHNSDDYANLTGNHAAWLKAHPDPVGSKPAPAVFPISDTLMGLRKSLLQASGTLPCFDIAPGETVGDSIKFEFEVDKALDPTVGFSFLIVTAKADDKMQNKADNTITVTFAPHARPAARAAPKPGGK